MPWGETFRLPALGWAEAPGGHPACRFVQGARAGSRSGPPAFLIRKGRHEQQRN
jgi:hypothetical protein